MIPKTTPKKNPMSTGHMLSFDQKFKIYVGVFSMSSIKAKGNARRARESFDAFYPGTNQNITSTGSSQQSNAFGDDVSLVRIYCETDTYLAMGSNPTASTSSMIIPGGGVEYLCVNPAEKVAILQVSSAGKVTITQGATS